ncbi:hypothetical protein ACLOJK_015113, partial [Asimina triloba]
MSLDDLKMQLIGQLKSLVIAARSAVAIRIMRRIAGSGRCSRYMPAIVVFFSPSDHPGCCRCRLRDWGRRRTLDLDKAVVD